MGKNDKIANTYYFGILYRKSRLFGLYWYNKSV